MHSRFTISGTVRIAALALLLLSLCAPATVFAAPPSNDDFANATVITSLPFSATESTLDATMAFNDPTDNGYPVNSVWFAYTPAQNVAMTTIDTNGSNYSAAWNVYTGAQGALALVASSYCSSIWNCPARTFNAVAGTTYYIMVFDLSPWMWSGGNLVFSMTGTTPPANDDFDNATVIVALPFNATQTMTGATVAPDDPVCNYESTPNSVWFKFTPSQDLALRPNFSGSTIQGYLCGYTGARGSLTKVAGPNTLNGNFTFDVQAGTTYYFMVVSYYGLGGDLAFSLNGYPHLKATMQVTGGTADSITGIATLRGTMNCSRPAGGPLVIYKFEQPVGRVNIIKADTVWASINNCNGVTPWQVAVVPTNGKYAGGKVNASVGFRLFDAESGEEVSLPATNYVVQLTGGNGK